MLVVRVQRARASGGSRDDEFHPKSLVPESLPLFPLPPGPFGLVLVCAAGLTWQRRPRQGALRLLGPLSHAIAYVKIACWLNAARCLHRRSSAPRSSAS